MSPSLEPEHAPMRRYEPRRFFVEERAWVQRGLAELRPQRLSFPKLASSVVRHLSAECHGQLAAATILMPLLEADAEETYGLLGDVAPLNLGPPPMTGVLSALWQGIPGRQIFAVLGDGERDFAEAHAPFARSLAVHNPQIETRFCHDLAAACRQDVPLGNGVFADALVVEERPGRAIALALSEASRKVNGKRWQAAASRNANDQVRQPATAAHGFGVTGLLLTDEQASANLKAPANPGRTITLCAMTTNLRGSQVGVGTGPALKQIAAAWLASVQGPELRQLRQLHLAVPSAATAASVAAAFRDAAPQATPAFRDLMDGWQPSLTMLELLWRPLRPALFIGTGRFPEVHFVLSW